MTQYNTNMKQSNFYGYCAAWAACHEDFSNSTAADFFGQAVRAGIVFG